MAFLTKTKVAEIINGAPPGTSPAGIVKALRNQGHELEGYGDSKFTPATPATPGTLEAPQKPQKGFALRFLGNLLKAPGQLAEGLIGGAKGLGQSIVGGVEAVQAGFEKVIERPPAQKAFEEEKFKEIGESLEPKGELQKAGFAAEKILEAILPVTKATKAIGAAPFVANFAKAFPKVAGILGFVGRSVGTSTAITASQEQRLPTRGEIATFGLIDLGLGGLSKLGGAIYRNAFRDVGKKAAERLAEFGTTAGKVAEKQGLGFGTPTTIKNRAIAQGQKVWQELINLVQKVKPVTADKFNKIRSAMVKPFEKLADSARKTEAIAAVDEVLSKFKPIKPMTGEQIVEVIKDINSQLFNQGGREVLSPKQIKSLLNIFKRELKKFLPTEAGALYPQLSQLKTIENIMKTSEVKKILARSGITGLFGAGSAIAGGLGGGRDFGDILKNAIFLGIGGATLGGLSGSVAIKTFIGSLLKGVGTIPATQALKQTVAPALGIGANETEPQEPNNNQL